jgi:hypothetical protein
MRLVLVLMVLTPGLAFAQAEAPPPPPTIDPYAPVVAPPLGPPPPGLQATAPVAQAQLTLSPSLRRQWRGARVMNGFADAIGLLSTGLSLSGTIYVLAAHYPPSVSDLTAPPKPSDPAQVLSFVSSTSSVFAFGLSAGGLAIRHHVLRQLDADTGRGLFLSGTVIGLVGIAAIVTSYIIGFSGGIDPHNGSIASLSTSLGGSALCNLGVALYAKDASNMQKVWKHLTTF